MHHIDQITCAKSAQVGLRIRYAVGSRPDSTFTSLIASISTFAAGVSAVMSRPLGDFKFIVFGSENDDVLTGQGKDDRLYGGWRISDGFWKEAA